MVASRLVGSSSVTKIGGRAAFRSQAWHAVDQLARGGDERAVVHLAGAGTPAGLAGPARWYARAVDDTDIERFLDPVREHLDDAVAELTAGRKRTHWMWFMFPQLRELGRSDMARRYGLADLDEARRFVVHEELGPTYERLVTLVDDAVVRQGIPVHDVFGSPDDLKLVSSLTLFLAAAEREGRIELAARCGALLDAAERQGLPRCPVTTAALGPAAS